MRSGGIEIRFLLYSKLCGRQLCACKVCVGVNEKAEDDVLVCFTYSHTGNSSSAFSAYHDT